MSEVAMQDPTQTPPPQPPATRPPDSGGGCGCWIPALLTSFVVFVLVLVGLFLPPVDLWNRLFGTQYAVLSADANAVAEAGLTLIVDPASPGQNFGVALQTIPADNFLNGRVNADWARAALAASPARLALQSPVYTIETSGRAPDRVTLDLALPPQVGSPDLLSLYAWDPQALEWRFVPSSLTSSGHLTATVADVPQHLALFQVAPPPQPVVLVSVDVAQALSPQVGELATIVAPAGLQPTMQGTLTGSLAAGFDLNAGYIVAPIIRNFVDPRALDPETVEAIISSRSLRAEHIAQITSFASTGFGGVIIDYRDLPAEQRASFSAFIEELRASLDRLGLLLGVVVPGAENIAGTWETGAYDWQRIGRAADLVQINLPLNPQTYTPGANQLVEAMLRWSVGQIDRSKLLVGLSARSVRQTAGSFAPVGYAEALAGLGDVTIEADTTEAGTVLPGSEIRAGLDGLRAVAGREAPIFTSYVEYLNDNDEPVSRMWLTTGEALRFRMDRTLPFALGGAAFEDLLAADLAADVLPTILNYKLQLPAAPTERELALRWRIESAAGLVGETLTSLNDALVVTLEAPDGNYAVNVAVVDGEAEIPRSGAAVALFAPTLTPTPPPTATPTPPPTRTPAPVAQQPASSGPAVAPGAGSINMGGFEYGGHVTTTNSDRAANAMRQAGMTWMKVQIKHGPGMDPGAAAAHEINGAKSRGFKVLIAVVGDIGALGSNPDGYIADYARFLGGLAALGPDAIEVWNEPNLDREWPRGQISGAMYANMLRQSYQAIKAANGGVMVISGAPAPTGAELAFPGQVMNDDNWIRELVNAGGLQYMDCLGAHYNEGVVAPSQRSGDPRDNYYTRYFFGMLDTYWGLIGGQKPICFTELGYLTSAGYGPLPAFFSWASGVTLEQHAAWLAEAAALASQSGRVRLMIVWNVDFTFYGADPMAGYAMIRADGSCPACQAFAGAR
jgi:hypothetical protein